MLAIKWGIYPLDWLSVLVIGHSPTANKNIFIILASFTLAAAKPSGERQTKHLWSFAAAPAHHGMTFVEIAARRAWKRQREEFRVVFIIVLYGWILVAFGNSVFFPRSSRASNTEPIIIILAIYKNIWHDIRHSNWLYFEYTITYGAHIKQSWVRRDAFATLLFDSRSARPSQKRKIPNPIKLDGFIFRNTALDSALCNLLCAHQTACGIWGLPAIRPPAIPELCVNARIWYDESKARTARLTYWMDLRLSPDRAYQARLKRWLDVRSSTTPLEKGSQCANLRQSQLPLKCVFTVMGMSTLRHMEYLTKPLCHRYFIIVIGSWQTALSLC